MGIKNLYHEVFEVVCRITEMDKDSILHSNKEQCVDARYLLVYILSQHLTDEEISEVSGLSRTCANKIRNTFKNKSRKFSVKCKLTQIHDELDTTLLHDFMNATKL